MPIIHFSRLMDHNILFYCGLSII